MSSTSSLLNGRIVKKHRKMNTGDLEVRIHTAEAGRAAPRSSYAARVLEPYKYLVGHTCSERTLVASYAVREMKNTDDKQLLGVAFASFLVTTYPAFLPPLTAALAKVGVDLEPVNVTTEIDQMGVLFDYTVPEPLPTSGRIIVWLACSVLILFKNIGDVNYVNYMTARLRAIKAIAGAADDDESQNPFTVAKAKTISRIFGVNHELKKAVLLFLMDHMEVAPLGSVATYLAHILYWNEMTSLKFMYEELMVPESPVLMSPSVSQEVRMLRFAFEKILNSPYPQYFRYFAPAEEAHLLFNRNFPTLSMVAREIKIIKTGQKPVKNYVTFTQATNPLVEQLIKMHMDYLKNPRVLPSSLIDDFKFLTDMRREGDEEEEDGIIAHIARLHPNQHHHSYGLMLDP